jgi:hypothetical protein
MPKTKKNKLSVNTLSSKNNTYPQQKLILLHIEKMNSFHQFYCCFKETTLDPSIPIASYNEISNETVNSLDGNICQIQQFHHQNTNLV